MTTKLREITERLIAAEKVAKRYGIGSIWCNEDLAYLLNRVVKERTELIARTDENIEITLRQARVKALRELDLVGVGLGCVEVLEGVKP